MSQRNAFSRPVKTILSLGLAGTALCGVVLQGAPDALLQRAGLTATTVATETPTSLAAKVAAGDAATAKARLEKAQAAETTALEAEQTAQAAEKAARAETARAVDAVLEARAAAARAPVSQRGKLMLVVRELSAVEVRVGQACNFTIAAARRAAYLTTVARNATDKAATAYAAAQAKADRLSTMAASEAAVTTPQVSLPAPSATPATSGTAEGAPAAPLTALQASGDSYGKDVFGYLVANRTTGADGLWNNASAACRRCGTGPGLAAAALAARTGDPFYRDIAVRIFDSAINQGYDPVTGGILNQAGTAANDIETAFFAGTLGTATVILGDRLDATHRERYASVVKSSADFLKSNGNLSWYTNGNIVLANAVVEQAAYRLTGEEKYRTAAQQALDFAVAPGAARWGGRGLVVTRQPTSADGSDGAGYFTEEGAGGVGFDAEYSMLQADMLVQLDVLGADGALRLLNLVVNQHLPLIDRSTLLVDLSRGSRHTGSNRIHALQSTATTYLARHGRDDLRTLGDAAARSALTDVKKNVQEYQAGLRFAYGTIWLTVEG